MRGGVASYYCVVGFVVLTISHNLQDKPAGAVQVREPADQVVEPKGPVVDAPKPEGQVVDARGGPNMSRRHVYSRGYHAAEKIAISRGKQGLDLKKFCREAAQKALKKAGF